MTAPSAPAVWCWGRRGRRHLVLVYAGLLGALALLVVWPFVCLGIAGLTERATGAFTLAHVRSFWASAFYRRALVNSAWTAVAVAVLAVAVAWPIAWTVTRGPRRLRTPLAVIAAAPLVAPPVIYGIVLIVLLGRRGVVTTALGLTAWSVYSPAGVIAAEVLTFLPVAVLLIQDALRHVDGHVEDAAATCGAGEWTILRTVLLPLTAPAMGRAAVMVFALSLADLPNQALLGVNTPYLATEAFALLTGENDVAMAAVASLVLVALAVAGFGAERVWSRRRRFALAAAGPADRRVGQDRGVAGALVVVSGVVLALVVACVGTLAVGALTTLVGVRWDVTTQHLRSAVGWAALVTSLQVSLVSAIVVAVGGLAAAYLMARTTLPGRRLAEALMVCGYAAPGTVVGVAYVLTFNRPPLVLTGTMSILVASMVCRFLAAALQAGVGRLEQIPTEIEEASATLGAGLIGTWWRVLAPLTASAAAVAFVYTFMSSMNSMSAAIFLVSPSHQLASVYIFQLADRGSLGLACGLALQMMVAAFVVLAVGHRLVTQAPRGWSG